MRCRRSYVSRHWLLACSWADECSERSLSHVYSLRQPFVVGVLFVMPPRRIAALKRQIAGLVNHPAHCLRVRLKTGKEAGKIFRDDRTLRANMPGLCDGKEVRRCTSPALPIHASPCLCPSIMAAFVLPRASCVPRLRSSFWSIRSDWGQKIWCVLQSSGMGGGDRHRGWPVVFSAAPSILSVGGWESMVPCARM